jgi:Amt family ammonium transporter
MSPNLSTWSTLKMLARQDNATEEAVPTAPEILPGNEGFVLLCACLVMLMIPGLGYFYSGLARSKNALSLIFVCFLSMAIISLQWFFFGYSLSFADTATNPMIGNCEYCVGLNVWSSANTLAPNVSNITFWFFQLMFASITPAIIFGSAAERVRILPGALFIFLWSTIVYDFVAYWTWGAQGWIKLLGAYDFAGGTVVHITSGFASLAYALVVGKRHGEKSSFKPHSASNVMLGTALLWFGWFGFNGGSALGANARAAMAMLVTHLSACTGGLVWTLMDYRKERKWSAVGFCAGAISGLVGITPGSGFVGPASAIAIGAITAICCNLAVEGKHKLGYDDALDCFGVHGVGGFVGCILTGIFAQSEIASLDGTTIAGGWLNQHWISVPVELGAATAAAAWSFFWTAAICWTMDKIPGLALRLHKDAESLGTDAAELGEYAYDYVESLSQVQEWGNYNGYKKDAVAASANVEGTVSQSTVEQGLAMASDVSKPPINGVAI